MIQDWIFLVGGLVLIAGLIPSLGDAQTCLPPVTTVPTALVMFIFAWCQFSLDLPLGGATSLAMGLIWLALIPTGRR